MVMKKHKKEIELFANEGGINGTPTGRTDIESEDFQILKAKIQEQAAKMTPQQRTELHLLGIKYRMEDYLRNENLFKPNDMPTLLAECIEGLEIKKKDFAAYIGIEDSNLSAMLKGRRRVSPEFALKLEQIFGISATLWLSVQNKNELEALRKERNHGDKPLSMEGLLTSAGKVKPISESKKGKNEPLRKAAGQ